MLRSYDDTERRAKDIRDAEHRGDEISHDIGGPPRADVRHPVRPRGHPRPHQEAADTFVLYRIDAPTQVAIQLAAIVVRQCEQLHEALGALRT